MTISPGYFEVFKIPVRHGRTFNERDTATSTPVVIINEAMAKQYWPKSDPLTDRLVIGKGVMREFATEGERQIVGVVADIKSNGLDSDPQPQMFIPQAQVPDAGQRAERQPDADLVDRAHAGAAAVAEQRHPGSAAPGRPACRSPTSRRWTRSSRSRCRASASTCG